MVFFMNSIWLFFVLLIHNSFASPCDVTGGRSEIILDVMESEGEAFDQPITPETLSVEGEPGSEIDLSLSREGAKRFVLQGKKISLKSPLDRDLERASILRFEINCMVKATSRVRNIPVVIRIQDINDNAPEFQNAPYRVSINEDTPVNSPIFAEIKAVDLDAGRNGQIEYLIQKISPQASSNSNPFAIRFPYQGTVFLKSSLDFESISSYNITIMAIDNPGSISNRLNSTTTLTIQVNDVDDQNPIFDTAVTPLSCSAPENYQRVCIREYYSSIVEGIVSGVLNVSPGKISASDPDSLSAPIIYSFVSGSPHNYQDYFAINSLTGAVRQIKEINRNLFKKFDITIQATEDTPRKGRTLSRLLVNVEKIDRYPPKLVILGTKGKVFESSKPGTPVLLDDGTDRAIFITVSDLDIEPGEKSPMYSFELTTNSFRVNREGVLEVADSKLDRDPPSLAKHTFQIIARENRDGGRASPPVTIFVRLLDINDNAPRMPILPTVTIPAGSESRKITEIRATDIDDGENAEIRYEITGGSRGKFVIDSATGVVTSTGALKAGQKFFIKVSAIDKGNLKGNGFVEVTVSRGPNTNGPVFHKTSYSVTVPENIPYGEQILQVMAKDPENDTSYYSISKGDPDGLFEIDTLTGQITVVAPLDRESKGHYSLSVTSTDSEGKSNSVPVSVIISDVNDITPSFVGEPYSFRVDEGLSSALVGTVKATDGDLGKAGAIEYLVEGNSHLFSINETTGQIFTKTSLDYEKQQVHYVTLIARDKANDPLSSTTTATVLVNDLSDEKPKFSREKYLVNIREDAEVRSVITTVHAIDEDTKPSVTYKMIEGDAWLFKLEPKSGLIFLAGKLDYERNSSYSLIIGTEENDGREKEATTKVIVTVEDVNDEYPVIAPLHTVTLAKRAPLNTLVTTVIAVDKDGSVPNNQIKYSLKNGRSSFFKIDDETGEIRLWRSLAGSNKTELEVTVVVTDEGSPPLSSTSSFRVLLLQSAFQPSSLSPRITQNDVENGIRGLASSPRFSKDHLEIQVKENMPSGSVLAKVPLVSTSSVLVTCTILRGDENGTFKTRVTFEGNCNIISSKMLDFEVQSKYELVLVLHPMEFKVESDQDSSVLSSAVVTIRLRDDNDNAPKFNLEEKDVLEGSTTTTILTYALQESPIRTNIIELQAKDDDSGKLGFVSYKLLPETNRGNYFSVNPKTGRIYTKRKLRSIPLELLPFNLTLVAYDNPDKPNERQSTAINIVIPVVENHDRSVLIVNASKDEVRTKLNNLKTVLSDMTGNIVQLEDLRFARGKYKSESQVWFHLIERKTLKPKTLTTLFRESEEVLARITEALGGLPPLEIISPSHLRQRMEEEQLTQESRDFDSFGRSAKASLLPFSGTLEYVLTGLAGVIILFVAFAITTTCILWARFSKKWNSADKTVMLIPPVVTQPSSIIDSVSKEYEVQVLHMSVPMDDDSMQGTQGRLKSPSQAYLDNVSYISKSRNNLDCSSSGASSGMMTPCGHRQQVLSRWSPGEGPSKRQRNGDLLSSTYLREDPGILDVEPCRENTFFARNGLVRNSMETTTEL